MPRRGSPYGPAHEKLRKALIKPGTLCHFGCGRQASELDHVPPLALHDHHEGTSCCVSLPACWRCQREQAAELGWHRHGALDPVVGDPVAEPDDSPGPDDPIWDVPWLDELRDVPDSATWPRFMTAPHPAAVGSYGAEAVEWLAERADIVCRWWQTLALVRQLEHDAQGELVWLTVLETTARQVGKSILLRGGATWRLHRSELFGEEQTVMHTGKDLAVCKEVQRPARTWAKAHRYQVFEGNGAVQITEPESGSRWLVRAKDGVYGYAVSNGLVDEAWGVAPGIVEDGLEPTMAERSSPQLVLASTAHSRATSLFPTHRLAALEELEVPDSTLIVEWTARRDAELDDPAAWRQASPHWSKNRQRIITQRLARVHAGELLDPDESDPVESFRSQYLNIWPVRTSSDPGGVLIDADLWAARLDHVDTGTGRVFVAVDDNYGRGAAVAAVARATDGRFELDGWLVESWAEGFADVGLLAGLRDSVVLAVSPSLANEVEPRYQARVMSAANTRAGLALLRQMVGAGQVCHDEAPDLAQLTAVHVKELASGLSLVAGARADLARASAWALLAAHETQAEPAIH